MGKEGRQDHRKKMCVSIVRRKDTGKYNILTTQLANLLSQCKISLVINQYLGVEFATIIWLIYGDNEFIGQMSADQGEEADQEADIDQDLGHMKEFTKEDRNNQIFTFK